MCDSEGQCQRESTNHNKKSFDVAEISPKIIRFITVVVYLSSVSMAAVILSLYYLFFWNPTVHSGPERLVDSIQLHLPQFYFNDTQKVIYCCSNKKPCGICQSYLSNQRRFYRTPQEHIEKFNKSKKQGKQLKNANSATDRKTPKIEKKDKTGREGVGESLVKAKS